MIYTVTLNPSLDYVVQMERFRAGGVNRTAGEAVYPGGKGINVSIVLQNLGIPSKALGFCAGFTGREISRMLAQYGCECDFIWAESGFSRINVKIKAETESELNGQGPVLSDEQAAQLFDQLDRLQKGDILVLAGSVPSSLPADIYEQILKRLAVKEVHFVIDTSGESLTRTLMYRPFLIKPNHHEIGALFDVTISSHEEAVPYAKELQKRGARNVLVSLAGKGAIFIDETGAVYQSEAPQGTVVNSVGAGDSMVAGFLAGYLKTRSYETAFRMGIAAGSATAFTGWLASKEEIETLLTRVEVAFRAN